MALTITERSKRYTQRHPEKRAASYKKYRQSSKGRLKILEWVNQNREKLNKYHNKWAKKNVKKCSILQKNWRKKNPDKNSAQKLRWISANPEKVKAHRELHKAIKDGILNRPSECGKCGKKARIDAHHHKGYNLPLEVLWLCRQCHVDAHHEATRQASSA